MGALALEMRPEVQRPLAPRLDAIAGGLEQHREVTGKQLRTGVEHVAEAVELVLDLLALVERQRAVEARLTAGADLLGEAEEDGEPALHVGGPQPVEHVAVEPRHGVAVGGHGVEVTAEHDPALASELRACDHGVPDAREREL